MNSICTGPPGLAAGTRVIWRVGLEGTLFELQPASKTVKITREKRNRRFLNELYEEEFIIFDCKLSRVNVQGVEMQEDLGIDPKHKTA